MAKKFFFIYTEFCYIIRTAIKDSEHMRPFKDWQLYSQLFTSGTAPVLFAVIIISTSFSVGLVELKNDAISAQNVIQDIRSHFFLYTSELREYLISTVTGEPDGSIFIDLKKLEQKLDSDISAYARISENKEAASKPLFSVIDKIYTQLKRISDEIAQQEIELSRHNRELEALESEIERIFEEVAFLAETEIKNEMILISLLGIGAIITSLLAASIFVRKISTQIVHQIHILRAASEDFGEGQFQSRAYIDSSNEMGQLSIAFNKMADDLQKSLHSLETEVQRRRISEEKLKQSHLELESRVAQRSEELKQTYQQLAHAGRLTALGEMATGIAHEIRQPLAIIDLANRSLGNFFKNKYTDLERARSSSSKIAEQVKRADKIINNMRAFARTDSIELMHIDLTRPVKTAASFFKEQCKLHNIALEVKCEGPIPSVFSDPQKIEQIVINLISNARFAVESKRESSANQYPIWIRIRIYQNTQNSAVCLEVSDNGIGMDQEETEKCMEPFFTTKRVGMGTGLGLSIVYNIVRELNGNIVVQSEKNIGSTFIVSFPI